MKFPYKVTKTPTTLFFELKTTQDDIQLMAENPFGENITKDEMDEILTACLIGEFNRMVKAETLIPEPKIMEEAPKMESENAPQAVEEYHYYTTPVHFDAKIKLHNLFTQSGVSRKYIADATKTDFGQTSRLFNFAYKQTLNAFEDAFKTLGKELSVELVLKDMPSKIIK